MESLLENLPWILAALLGLSEALAHVPALKSNSILQMITSGLRKAKDMMKALRAKKEEEKSDEEKKEEAEKPAEEK